MASQLSITDIFTFTYAVIHTMNECSMVHDKEGANIAFQMLLGQRALLNFLKEKGVQFSFNEASQHEELDWLILNLSKGKQSAPEVKIQ